MKASLLIFLAVCASLCLCHATSARKVLTSAREATLSGRCLTLTDEIALTSTTDATEANNILKGLRSSMYRDGDVLAVYQLDDKYKSLAGCANACLLDWRKSSLTNQTQVTKSEIEWNPSTTDIDPIRECEYFNFNIDNGKCTLISAQTSTQLTSSDNYWSGKLLCADIDDIQDWAEQVVADAFSPPPPPPPP